MTPQELKNSILQLAIQGKLVEQRAEEGTAEDLYRQIQTEKVRLIKAGKIKKEKPLPEIAEDELPFDIPESWKWVRARDIIRFINGRAYSKNELLQSGKYRILRVGNFFTNDSWYYSDLELEKDKYCENGDLLYAWSASFGPKIWNGEKVIYHYHIWKLDYFQPLFIKFLYYALLADTSSIRGLSHGLGFVFVTKSFMEARPFPLPPLAEQKRIVAKIEELLPLIDRYEQAWAKLEKFNKRFPVDMQKSLLQMAIQGKLVEQRAEEGTGEELYQQIQAEKAALVKEGKIKKEKPLPEITEDEIPFDIPESWKWVRLRNLCTKIVDGDHNPPSGVNYKTEYYMLSAKNINNDSVCELDTIRYLTEDVFVVENQRTQVEVGDIFFTIVGTLGRSCVYKGGYNLCFQRSVSVLRTLAFNYYLKYALDSASIQNFMVANATGTAQKGFYLNQVEKLVIPLPPLAEQKRIVAKLEELLPLCDRLK